MSKSVIFPYGITLRSDAKIETFPAAEVEFFTQEKEWLSLFLVIDSGATISTLPKTDAEVLGVNLRKGRIIDIHGVGTGIVKGWVHELKIRIGGSNKVSLPVVFLDSNSSPRVLGREGVFNRFMIIFDEREQRTGMLPQLSREIKSVREILEGIK